MARKHLTFVVHGARADRPDLRQMVSWVRDRGHAVDVRITWNPGDGAALAAEAADRGTDVVIACGGDGTLNEVVNGLDGREVPLGVIPLGPPTTSRDRQAFRRKRIMPWMLSCAASPCASIPRR